jgi:hypothetical protein
MNDGWPFGVYCRWKVVKNYPANSSSWQIFQCVKLLFDNYRKRIYLNSLNDSWLNEEKWEVSEMTISKEKWIWNICIDDSDYTIAVNWQYKFYDCKILKMLLMNYMALDCRASEGNTQGAQIARSLEAY